MATLAEPSHADAEVHMGGVGIALDLPRDADADPVATIARLTALNAELAERCSQLQHALDSRIVIEQAKGILAERHRTTVDDAFALLRSAARRNRIRIHELAAGVVARRAAAQDEPPAPEAA